MEKKLTDKEIVEDVISHKNAAEAYGFVQITGKQMSIWLDLINRLQDDYSKLKERYIKVLDLNEKVIAKQKAEIERLTEENTQLEKDVHDMSWVIKIHKYCVGANHCQNRSDGEFELQKQVDELKSENTELYKEHTTLIAGSILEKQNTVKETAKEILGVILAKEFEKGDYLTDEELHEIFKERYGVEVE